MIINRHDDQLTPAHRADSETPAHPSSLRLTDALIEIAIDKATPRLVQYWEEIFGGRGDPGIRGFLTQIDEAQEQVLIIPLDYEASIAAAWLIRAGLNRRLAAALASEGHALALPASPEPSRRPDGEYDLFDQVMLNDGTEWSILMTTERLVEPRLVENYSVVLVRNGVALDLDEHPYPTDLMTSTSPLSAIQGTVQ